jgi:tRNA modification GTPase
LDAVNKVKEAISFQISTELLAYELRNALEHLGEISVNLPMMKCWEYIFLSFVSGNNLAFL